MSFNKFVWEKPVEISVPGLTKNIHLDQRCWSCNPEFVNSSHKPDVDEFGHCRICGDKGFILTEAGEAIMKLLERHGENDASKNR